MLSKEEMWQIFCLANNFDINTKHDCFKFCGGGPIGNKSLKQWQELHRDFFSLEYKEYGSTFDENADCVLEEFKVVYK